MKYRGWVTHALMIHPRGSVNGAVVNILHASVYIYLGKHEKDQFFPHTSDAHTSEDNFIFYCENNGSKIAKMLVCIQLLPKVVCCKYMQNSTYSIDNILE